MEKVFASPSRYVQGKMFLKLVFLTFWLLRSSSPSLRPYRL